MMTMDSKMIKAALLSTLMLVSTAGVLLAVQRVQAAEVAVVQAHEQVQKTTDQLLARLVREKKNFKSKPELLYDIVREELLPYVDFDQIAKSVMAQSYRNATADQRLRFRDAFRDSLIRTYANGLAAYDNQKITVKGSKAAGGDASKALVDMEIRTSDGAIYPVQYSVYRAVDGTWKLVNITINGINLGKTFRTQFSESMNRNRQDIDKVIASWSGEVGAKTAGQKGGAQQKANADQQKTASSKS